MSDTNLAFFDYLLRDSMVWAFNAETDHESLHEHLVNTRKPLNIGYEDLLTDHLACSLMLSLGYLVGRVQDVNNQSFTLFRRLHQSIKPDASRDATIALLENKVFFETAREVTNAYPHALKAFIDSNSMPEAQEFAERYVALVAMAAAICNPDGEKGNVEFTKRASNLLNRVYTLCEKVDIKLDKPAIITQPYMMRHLNNEQALGRMSDKNRKMIDNQKPGGFFPIPKNSQQAVAAKQGETLDDVWKKFDHLVGLHEVKDQVLELIDISRVNQERKSRGLTAEPVTLHMVFAGPPGTGKTTVARLVGDAFRVAGLLPKGHLVELNRADIVGQYVGHTEAAMKKKIDESQGGILFIDEAYTLFEKSSDSKDFGEKALQTLLPEMENKREKFCVILAGYPEQMENLLQFNDGMKRRIGATINFHHFSNDELLEVFDLMLKDSGYTASPAVREAARGKIIEAKQKQGTTFGNAGTVRDLVDAMRKKHSKRFRGQDLSKLSNEDLSAMTLVDMDGITLDKTPKGAGKDATPARKPAGFDTTPKAPAPANDAASPAEPKRQTGFGFTPS